LAPGHASILSTIYTLLSDQCKHLQYIKLKRKINIRKTNFSQM